MEEGNAATTLIASGLLVLRSLRTWHAEKQHAREPGDLLDVLVNRSRPVREGHKPNGGRERSGEVGLCRSVRGAAHCSGGLKSLWRSNEERDIRTRG